MSLAAVVLTLNSCYIKEDIPFVPPVVENPAEYVVTIYTVDAGNGNTPMDIDLPLFGIDATKVTRTSTGVYQYRPTSAGNPSFMVSKTGYYDAFATVNIPRGEVNEVIHCSVLVALTPKTTTPPEAPAKYTLWGRVIKGVDNSNLTPTTVTSTMRGKVVTSTVTITNNIFKVEFPEPGVYDITVNAAGFESVTLTQNIQKIPDGQEFVSELTVPMYLIGTYQGQYYSIRGTVMNTNRAVQLGATMTTLIGGVTNTSILLNGTYEVLNLTNDKTVSFLFVSSECYPSSFEISLAQFSGTPSITYDVYLRPLPTVTGSSSAPVVPDQNDGTIPSNILLITQNAPPSPNLPSPIHASLLFPSGTVFTNTSNQILTQPFGISAALSSQILPAETAAGAQHLGTSLFALNITPEGINFSGTPTIAITNPFGSLNVDDSYLALTTDVQTRGMTNLIPLTLVGDSLTGHILKSGTYNGVTFPSTPRVIETDLKDDGQYTEDFYNSTGTSLSDVVYEYYAKTGNVYAPGNTPEQVLDAANLTFANANERLYVIAYMKSIIKEQLGETVTALTPVKVLRETGTSCAANQYMKTTTSYKYTERYSTFSITDSTNKTVTLVIMVRNYITSSAFELDIYNASHHTTGSHISNNGAGGGYGSSNL